MKTVTINVYSENSDTEIEVTLQCGDESDDVMRGLARAYAAASSAVSTS